MLLRRPREARAEQHRVGADHDRAAHRHLQGVAVEQRDAEQHQHEQHEGVRHSAVEQHQAALGATRQRGEHHADREGAAVDPGRHRVRVCFRSGRGGWGRILVHRLCAFPSGAAGAAASRRVSSMTKNADDVREDRPASLP